MTTRPSRSNPNWLPYAGLMLSAAGIIYQSGVVTNKVEALTDRVVKLEASDKARTETLDIIKDRGARIEAKLDYALPQGKEDRR